MRKSIDTVVQTKLSNYRLPTDILAAIKLRASRVHRGNQTAAVQQILERDLKEELKVIRAHERKQEPNNTN